MPDDSPRKSDPDDSLQDDPDEEEEEEEEENEDQDIYTADDETESTPEENPLGAVPEIDSNLEDDFYRYRGEFERDDL